MKLNGASHSFNAVLVRGKNSAFPELISVARKSGIHCTMVEGSDEFLEKISEIRPSFLFLDLIIDSRDAVDLIRETEHLGIRDDMTIAVFGEPGDNYVEIAVLNAGADDYLVKPVNKRLFAGRLNAWMRKQARIEAVRGADRPENALPFELDRDAFSLKVHNREISLQRKEFEIIALLHSRPKKVFSRKEIKAAVWGDPEGARNRTIDVHITNLRSKIGPDFIRTYKGVGYSFNG